MVTKWTQALRERYPENSDTCSPLPLWNPHCDTGGADISYLPVRTGLTQIVLHTGLRPEVFFKPQEVWEIRGAEYVHSFCRASQPPDATIRQRHYQPSIRSRFGASIKVEGS